MRLMWIVLLLRFVTSQEGKTAVWIPVLPLRPVWPMLTARFTLPHQLEP